MSRAPFFGSILLGLAVTLMAGPAFGTMKGGSQPGKVQFVSPWEGSYLADRMVILAGRLPPGKEKAEIYLNGKPLRRVQRKGGAFSADITAAQGRNVVEVSLGKIIGRLNFTYQPGRAPAYVHHAPLQDGECSACHDGQSRKESRVEAAVCYGCHDPMEKNSFVHGPVGAGECRVCHDPHGSSFPQLVRQDKRELCFLCHDQPSSAKHISRSGNQDCHRCHDPHGGKNRFFLKN